MQQYAKTEHARLVRQSACEMVEVFGPVLQFLTPLDQAEQPVCLMRGTIPPGISVPLHSHADVEHLYVMSGELEVFLETADGGAWTTARGGDWLAVPSERKHAFRNDSCDPVITVIETTVRLGRFFQEIGRPWKPRMPLTLPGPEDFRRLAAAAAKYKYRVADADENAAIGLPVLLD